MLLILLAGLAVFVVAILGGALGSAFGFGFLGAPLAAIQLPAEPVVADPIVGGFVLTNTMVATWITMIVLVVIALVVRSRMAEVPGRLQSVVEIVIEFFLNLAEGLAGKERARRFFPLVMTIFLFIFVANWIGILPGFGTIGRVESIEELQHHHCDKYEDHDSAEYKDCISHLSHEKVQVFDGDGAVGYLAFGSVGSDVAIEEWEEHPQEGKQAGILVPFFRSANTDVNTTLAIALVAMFMIHFWGFRALGLFGHGGKFITLTKGPIMFAVGILELISELSRVISFTFRLFGNIFAGEVLLAAMIFMIPLIGIIPFLGLELFVGVIQAFIFAMLTLVFAATATVSHDGDAH